MSGHLPPFERVVEQHGPALLRFCRAEAGPEHAEDCFQEAMLAALRAYDEVRDTGALRAWLFAIAARKAIDGYRTRAQAPQAMADVDAVASTVAPERDPALWGRVGRLPEKQRRAVVLRYAGDLSHREIALVMETSEDAARHNVFEGVARLRQEIRGVTRSSHEAARSAVEGSWKASKKKKSPRSKSS